MITWVVLMVLSIIAGMASITSFSTVVPIILGLIALKFLGVTFNFMEMKKAHSVWQAFILLYVVIFYTAVLGIFYM